MCFLLAIRQDLWPLKVWPSFLPRISNHRQTNALPRKPLNWQLVLRTDYDWKWVEQPKLFDTKKLSSRQRPVEPMEGARVWKGPMRTGLSIGTLSLNPQPVELAFEMPAGNPDHLRHRSEFSQCGKNVGIQFQPFLPAHRLQKSLALLRLLKGHGATRSGAAWSLPGWKAPGTTSWTIKIP